VVFAVFDSHISMTAFVRQQKDLEQFNGLYAARNKSPEERRFNRILNQIKRAYCEEMFCDGPEVCIDRRKRTVHYISPDDDIVDVASVTADGTILWGDETSDTVKSKTLALLEPEDF
jgi:hypothetical protein